jgi:ABC-type phosphate transport system permease subunit
METPASTKTDKPKAEEPLPGLQAHAPQTPSAAMARARFIDRVGKYFITTCAAGVLISVLLILLFLLKESLPLLTQPEKLFDSAQIQSEKRALREKIDVAAEADEAVLFAEMENLSARSKAEGSRYKREREKIFTSLSGTEQSDALEALDRAWPQSKLRPAHDDATLEKMFMPQVYRGYEDKPAQYIWQTESGVGGQDKYGIPLLMWGTVKGALWAMIFSLPLSLLAALFVSEFASPKARFWIKSAVELLAGIPTVIVGFFGFAVLSIILAGHYQENMTWYRDGLWVLTFVRVLVFVVVVAWLGGRSAALKKNRVLQKVGLWIAGACGGFVAAYAVGLGLDVVCGSVLRPIFGVERFTALNAMVCGVCLGFALVPIIFSVAEDALKAVPQAFREASLALGATHWDTAVRVVFPAALPGVYAAVFLGLARAIGETMIVLMITGNTAVMDFSPFTGMRTMSAAIAIETAEKAQFTTGWHVLFFVGAVLLLCTWVLNIAADQIIRSLKRRSVVG